jgi:hypothetical protein
MSWNMIIFGFGFILGGFTIMLILGLLLLAKDMTGITKPQKTVSQPRRDDQNPEISPRLTVLSGGNDRVSFNK